MRLEYLILCAAGAPAAAMAQAPAPAVVDYPPAFFAEFQVANAYEMLLRVPGFTLDAGDTVRGYEGAAGNVLIDSRRPVSKTDALDELLRRLPASRVARIEVIRGGAPGIDMQGKSVLANVVLKDGGGFRGLLALADERVYDGRHSPGARLELSGGEGRRSWEAAARLAGVVDDGGDDGPLVRTGPNGEVLRRSRVDGRSDGVDKVLTGAYEQPLLGGTARLNGRVFWEKWKTQEADDQDFPRIAPRFETTDETDFTRNTEAGLRWTRSLGAKAGIEVLGLRQGGRYRADQVFVSDGEAAAFGLRRRTTETILRAVATYRLSQTLALEAGGETARNVLRSATALTVGGAAQPIPAANVRVQETRSELFAKTTWRPASAWTLEAALRYETSRIASRGDVVLSKPLSYLKPRLSAAWQASPATQIRVRFERVVGQLNFDDFVAQAHFNTGTGVSAGNPNLNPEQAWVTEGAVEQKLPGGATGVLTLRHSQLKDVIDRGPVAIGGAYFDQPTNIGPGRKDELIAELTAPFDALGWKGGLIKAKGTWRRSKVTDPTTGERRPISKLRPLEWQIAWTQDLPAHGMTLGADLYGGWRETSYRFDSIRETKLHNAWLDVWVDRKLRPDLTLHVELDNLTQRGIRQTLHVWPGLRGSSPLAYTDDRDLHEGREVFVRIRKTFGA